MTDPDARLKAMLQADAPPAADPRFRIAVLERMERRRAGAQLAAVVIAGAAASAAAVLLGPQLSADFSQATLMLTGLLIAATATGWGLMQMRRPV